MFEFNIHLDFPTNNYKRLLKKLESFIRFSATIGIHREQGQQTVVHRYQSHTKVNKKGKPIMHSSGRTFKMNIIKLAYQNEFGANILIRPRYRYASKTTTTKQNIYHTFKRGQLNKKGANTIKTRVRSSVLRKASEQGYFLTDKNGKFVAYFKPESVIKIPKRSFIKKVVDEQAPEMFADVQNILYNTFISGGYRAREAFVKIAKIVETKMKGNIGNNQTANHPLTVKAKGSSSPLRDEKDRLYKSIKYKIYKDASVAGSKGNIMYNKQRVYILQKLIKKADQYTILPTQVSRTIFNNSGKEVQSSSKVL